MKPYYLVKLADKQPKLKTQDAAVADSLRLAKLNPGLSFEVLKCIAVSQTGEAITLWMDGEGPEPARKYRYYIENMRGGDLYYRESQGKYEWATINETWEETGHRPLDQRSREITAAELPEGIEP